MQDQKESDLEIRIEIKKELLFSKLDFVMYDEFYIL